MPKKPVPAKALQRRQFKQSESKEARRAAALKRRLLHRRRLG